MMHALELAGLICVSYALLAVNTCAITRGAYRPAMLTSSVWMVVNFFVIQRIAEARSMTELAGYMAGGLAGDALGMYISQRWMKP